MGLVVVLDVLVKNCQETGNEEETPEWFEFVRCQKQLDIMIWRGQRERLVICKFRILHEIGSKLTFSPHLVSFLCSRPRRVKTLTEEVNAAQGRLTDAAARGDGWVFCRVFLIFQKWQMGTQCMADFIYIWVVLGVNACTYTILYHYIVLSI